MKRIAAHIGLTVFCALAVAFYCSQTITIVIALACAALSILFLLIKRIRKKVILPVIAATAAICFGINLLYTAWAVQPVVEQFSGEQQEIEATLTDESYQRYAKYYYRLTTDRIDGQDVHVKILLKTDHPIDIEPFDSIAFTADITPTENNYYLAKGYYITVNTLDLSYETTKTESKPLYYHVIRLRQAMREAIETYLPQAQANLCNAILIGDKYALDQSVTDDFRNSGASHFVVVSGMHFSILCILSLLLFKKLLRKRWLYYPMTYLIILLYMMITGFQPSVMRSGIMMLILITGQWVMRQTDPLTSLGIAGLLMPVIFTPYGCGDIGTILSFAATFSILTWHEPIYQKIRIKRYGLHKVSRWLIKAINYILSLVAVCIAANILVLPLSAFLFNGFSLMTLFSSLVLYPLVWLIMIFSLFVCILCYLGPLQFIALLLSWPLYLFSKLTLWLVHTISSVPFSYIHVNALYFTIWIAVTLVVGITAYLLRGKYRLYPYVLLISALVFFGGFTVHSAILLNTNNIIYEAGKSGAAVYINYCGRIHLLRFDCDSSRAYQTLNKIEDDFGGVQCAVCTTNKEQNNYNKLNDMELPLEHYLMYRGIQETDNNNDTGEPLGGTSTVILDDGVMMKTFEDNGKILLYITDADKTFMMIPKGFAVEAIPADMRRADIILLDQADEGYDCLQCDILVTRPTSLSSEDLPQYNSQLTPSDSLQIKLN